MSIPHRLAMIAGLAAIPWVPSVAADPIVPVRARDEAFVDPTGTPVRFWGVNLVSLFPTHAEAEAIAASLAERGVNLVRPHHLLRPSSDWIHRGGVLGLNLLKDDTRTPDPEAWDRFDYLNAQLRRHGIYLALSLHFSRNVLPGDADVLETSPAERVAWQAAVAEMRSWDWRKSIDPFKMLPTFDVRARALQEEFARQLLGHINPYTGLAYGRDPQVLTVEVVNESSAEYALVCGNTFPAYFQEALDAKWQAFLRERGVEPFALGSASGTAQQAVRTAFRGSLDDGLMRHMTAVVRSMGCGAALTYSNLWRGEGNLDMHRRLADYIEDHSYMDPLVVREAADGFLQHSRTLLRGKPYVLGEFNQAEGADNLRVQGPVRTMLPLAAASYGSFHGYAGIAWFAWCHGDRSLGPDGWALEEVRSPHLGDLVADGMLLDHLRTCGLIFRRGLVAPSAEPQTLHVDDPIQAFDYNSLMRGKYLLRPGWQNVHSIRKAFGPVPEAQSEAPWMATEPPSPLVSDTGQIVKDTVRRQLTLAAPQAEGFSGYLDGKPPAGLKHLDVDGTDGFATVVAVCLDGRPFPQTGALLLSRTCVGADGRDRSGPILAIRGLRPPDAHGIWRLRLTRPRAAQALLEAFANGRGWDVEVRADGALVLPMADWHECELRWQASETGMRPE